MKVMIFVKKSHCNHQTLRDGIVSLLEKQGWNVPVVVVDIDTEEGLAEAQRWGVFVVPTVIFAANNRRKSVVISQGREQPTQEDLERAIFASGKEKKRGGWQDARSEDSRKEELREVPCQNQGSALEKGFL